jgi:hypothetical protein
MDAPRNIINMFKELKETLLEEVKESILTMFHQIRMPMKRKKH